MTTGSEGISVTDVQAVLTDVGQATAVLARTAPSTPGVPIVNVTIQLNIHVILANSTSFQPNCVI
jgi:hypothetical protein